ncbi:AI-2E family transporter [Bacillus sp. NEB1478]|uniref:AI-2E family transporter n=1 Tax=Bacillus sp. NEB1478 TaxID=3073816 RepID=UPI00287314E3|nr:AI-2E family transporter [Bacillus sp. NEB1478]WNB90965.1 AI-2E family transporter [Bacillus sp. NEB1478]
MPQSKAFRFGYGLLLAFLIIYVGIKIDFIFHPIFILVKTLFFPFLVAGVLYYLFRPLVNYLESKNQPRVLSILLIYLVAAVVITALIYGVGPILQKQVNNLVTNTPDLVDSARSKLEEIQKNKWVNRFQKNEDFNTAEISDKVTNYLSTSLSNFGRNITGLIGVITSIITVLVTVPFILFYMLKEGEKAPQFVLRLLPVVQRKNGIKILRDLDGALSSYIQGQIIVSVCVGVLLFIGYLIIGLDYSLILALIGMFTNVIPFLGPIIAIIPALIVAAITSPFMLVKVLIIMVIAQQIDNHIISPQVMGRSLEIHPLTIISILLVSGSLGGVLGLILAVPFYAVLKVIVQHTYRLWKLRREKETDPVN